ncbi:MAG: hypothetical protein EOM67_04745 [Spirochaetia bacterium]|nr:hypothetical protein [Spirochaetia bacterium]
MKHVTHKKHIIHIILFLLTLIGTPLLAASYPNVNEIVPLDVNNQTLLDKEEIQEFLSSWYTPLVTNFQDIGEKVTSNSTAIKSLESVVRIQDIQLDKLKRERFPKFSFVNTPQIPLYSFIENTSQSGSPPTTATITSHTFGLSGGIKQQLPTAGTVDLTLSHSASYRSFAASPWAWKQSPSATLSFSQPLFINNKIIDFSYASTLLERQIEQKENALMAKETTSDALSLTALSLIHTYQGLKEGRWLLMQEAILNERALENAKDDLDFGLISENQLLVQKNGYQQLLVQLSDLDNQIATLASSIKELGLEERNGSFTLPKISYDDIAFVASYSGNKLISNDAIFQKALTHDADYLSANSSLKDAQLQIALGNPADAPIINISMNYSPFVTNSTPGASFTESFSDIFQSSTKNNVSVSVSVIASDLSRSLSKSTKALAKEQLLQGEISLEEARKSVVEKIRSMQSAINLSLEKVKINTTAYYLAREQVEIEKIQAEVGLSNNEKIKRADLGMYKSAFSLLSSIRKVYEIKVSLEQMIK